MPLSNDALKQQLASRAHATSSGVAPASGGAPPAGGPQGVFDVSNDGINWHPAVRLTASTGTAFVVTNGEAVLTGQNAGMVEYADHATFRASPAPADGAVFRIISPPGEFRYSSSTGAGWADDDDTLLKPASVNVNSNGRAYSTRASEHAATFAAFRAMKGLLGRAKHVHVESHTTFGDGGGGIFDIKPVGAYVDDDFMVFVNGTAAGVRRLESSVIRVAFGGANKLGTADVSAIVTKALTYGNHIKFDDDGVYRFDTGVTIANSGVTIECGGATIVNNGPVYVFTVGTSGDTPSCDAFTLLGGTFTQATPATADNRNYLLLASVSNFTVRGCRLEYVGNGGITVYAGSEDGTIEDVTVSNQSAFSTRRAIWLNGATASDYADQLVDTATVARNATALPVYCVKRVSISRLRCSDVEYGVYLNNAHDCEIVSSHIDIGALGGRCIAGNNYCPGLRVSNNVISASDAGTGVLVSQAATGVVIADNIFRGTFAGGRAVYISYLAKAQVRGNHFSDNSTQNIQVEMGGFAVIDSNAFLRAAKTANFNRAVYLVAIDAAQAGTTTGQSATVLTDSGVVFTNNVIDKLPVAVLVDTSIAASNGNQPGLGIITIKDNTMLNVDQSYGTEAPLYVTAGTGSNVTNFRYEKNVAYPHTVGYRNAPYVVSGTAYHEDATNNFNALFELSAPASGGAITTTRVAGSNFGLTAARSADSLILYPRTQRGESGASIPTLLGFVDAGGATVVHRFSCVPSGANYLVSCFDSAGTQITLSTAGVKFRVWLGPVGVGG
jgi:hypothetical protein